MKKCYPLLLKELSLEEELAVKNEFHLHTSYFFIMSVCSSQTIEAVAQTTPYDNCSFNILWRKTPS